MKLFLFDSDQAWTQSLSMGLHRLGSFELAGHACAHQESAAIPSHTDLILLNMSALGHRAMNRLAALRFAHDTPIIALFDDDVSTQSQATYALALGAQEVLSKQMPSNTDHRSHAAIEQFIRQLFNKIGRLRDALQVPRQNKGHHHSGKLSDSFPLPISKRHLANDAIIMIGASTGGTEALRDIISALPADMPPILVTQHMPPNYTRHFAERLNHLSKLVIKQADDGEPVKANHVYIAPGDHHLQLSDQHGYRIALSNGPPVNRHRPSVQVMFRSALQYVPQPVLAVMLSGMGKDGAQAMLELKQAGATTMAQDQATSVVFGMAREAIALGAVDEVLPLNQMASAIVQKIGQLRHQLLIG